MLGSASQVLELKASATRPDHSPGHLKCTTHQCCLWPLAVTAQQNLLFLPNHNLVSVIKLVPTPPPSLLLGPWWHHFEYPQSYEINSVWFHIEVIVQRLSFCVWLILGHIMIDSSNHVTNDRSSFVLKTKGSTMRYCSSPVRMAISKRPRITSVGQALEKGGSMHIVGRGQIRTATVENSVEVS